MSDDLRTWASEFYQRAGVEPLLLKLQDAHRLNVNIVLWCLWSGGRYETPPDLVIRKAIDLVDTWSARISAPLRAARRALKSPPPQAPTGDVVALRAAVKAAELDAERIELAMLEEVASEAMTSCADRRDAPSRARRQLAIYARLAGAARTDGFSVSLLEELIALNFQSPATQAQG